MVGGGEGDSSAETRPAGRARLEEMEALKEVGGWRRRTTAVACTKHGEEKGSLIWVWSYYGDLVESVMGRSSSGSQLMHRLGTLFASSASSQIVLGACVSEGAVQVA